VWLEPVGHEYVDIPFASSLVLELHYDELCLADPSVRFKSHCFTVVVLSNNTPLRLGSCLEANAQKGLHSTTCAYTDFINHVGARYWPGDYLKACQGKP
jgi:hypothetical protein